MKKKIKIKINGKLNIIDARTKLSVFLRYLKVPIRKVAIELNREVVPKSKYKTKRINQNDRIEILELIGGG